jgi:hypothetical protein
MTTRAVGAEARTFEIDRAPAFEASFRNRERPLAAGGGVNTGWVSVEDGTARGLSACVTSCSHV